MKSLSLPIGALLTALGFVSLFSPSCHAYQTTETSAQKSAPSKPPPAPWENLPRFIDKFKSSAYLKAAEALQKLGKEEATKQLKTLATKNTFPNYPVFILCRMLFVPRKGGDFRRHIIGQPNYVGHANGSITWPLAPIALVNGVPFMVEIGVFGTGVPESPLHYLDYCLANCDWNPTQYQPHTKAELKSALKKLMGSPPLQGKMDAWDSKKLTDQLD